MSSCIPGPGFTSGDPGGLPMLALAMLSKYRTRASSCCVSWIYSTGGRGMSGGSEGSTLGGDGEAELDAGAALPLACCSSAAYLARSCAFSSEAVSGLKPLPEGGEGGGRREPLTARGGGRGGCCCWASAAASCSSYLRRRSSFSDRALVTDDCPTAEYEGEAVYKGDMPKGAAELFAAMVAASCASYCLLSFSFSFRYCG